MNIVIGPMKLILNEDDSFVPPQLDQLIKYSWCTLPEAVFALTELPKNGHFLSKIRIPQREDIHSEITEDRHDLILPENLSFNPTNYSKEFQKIFHAINEAIHNNQLAGRHFFIAPSIDILVKPYDVILWAINMQYTLPGDLQKALLIKQIKQRQLFPWLEKVKTMIVAQYSKLENPDMTQNEIIDSDLMKKYGKNFKAKYQTKNNSEFEVYADVSRQLKKDISVALGNSKQFIIKRIPYALAKRRGYFECNFELLKSIIDTCVRLVSEKVGLEKIRILSIAEFIDLMMRDKIIKLYVKEAPQIVIQFIERTIKEVYDPFNSILFQEMLFKNMPKQWNVKLE